MKMILIIFLLAGIGSAQESKVIPTTTTPEIDDDKVTVVYLSPGYTTSVRVPDEVNSVMIGNPTTFKAEHSEAEPKLVFLKPITAQPSESNAMITTKSGHSIALHLVSSGNAAAHARVDFQVAYHRPKTLLIDQSTDHSFIIAETRSIRPEESNGILTRHEIPDLVAQELEKQKLLSAPVGKDKRVIASVGASSKRDRQTILAFSILNNSSQTVEFLPPQIELTSAAHGHKPIKAEPIGVSEYRMTTRILKHGERLDGVVLFERPLFKESSERLQLRLAEAEQVDHPILLPVPFTAGSHGETQ
jgi:hypothetical protein